MRSALEWLRCVSFAGATLIGSYAFVLLLLTTVFVQRHVIYLHKIQLTWFKDLNSPEQFGFLRNQVTPFLIQTSEASFVHAWHILPLQIYRRNEAVLLDERPGLVSDFTSRTAFKLLRDDPEARLILHFHGAGGTVGSGHRTPNYRALSAGDPERVHVLTFDYRGFGKSPGTPSERGLLLDAVAVANWAMDVAGIPPSRILIFGQSLGTAVALGICEHFALQSAPVAFGGTILVAPFADVASLMATYKIAGTIPIVSPLARFPAIFKYLTSLTHERWSSRERIESYVRANELNGKRYRLTIIHAEDDFDIPWDHSQTLFLYAVKGASSPELTLEDLKEMSEKLKRDLGASGSVLEWRAGNGVIRKEIIKHGLHDVVMGYPVVTMAVMRMLSS